MSAPSSQRLFLGVPLDPAARAALAAYTAALGLVPGDASEPDKAAGRVVQAANWHVTLVFLGATLPAARDTLMRALSSAPLGPAFDLDLGAPGTFGRAALARVLWLGFGRGTEKLRTLQAAVQAVTIAAGFTPEERPFTPHLTLARLSPPRDAGDFLRAPAAAVTLPIHRIALFVSHPGRNYEELCSWPLADPVLPPPPS